MKSACSSERDWMWLPDVALASILSHLVTPQSYVRFSIVCKQWYSVAKDLHRHHIVTIKNQVPFLLIGTKDIKTSSDHDQWMLYSVTQDKVLDLKLSIPRYVIKNCCGSSHGWLAYESEDIVRSIALYNPFTRARIHLPPITSNFQFDDSRSLLRIQKVILSADPSRTEEYIVAARISNHWQGMLALIRPSRDGKWTVWVVMGFGNCLELEWSLGDIMFDKSGRWVYATTGNSGMMLVRYDFDVMETVVQARNNNLSRNYLVETTSNNGDNGDLLIISGFSIGGVKVFKLRDSSFVEVDDLNGDAVFIGYNHSTVVEGIEANCIYCCWDYPGSVMKFNVRDKIVRIHKVPQHSGPLFWISPIIALLQ